MVLGYCLTVRFGRTELVLGYCLTVRVGRTVIGAGLLFVCAGWQDCKWCWVIVCLCGLAGL